jgi:flavin-dependent dehydrogenase
MTERNIYDCAVIGGGLAGLTLAIQLKQQGYEVVLFEKEAYPYHKVCGEYIGMESYCFLQRCGVPLEQMDLPRITKLKVSAPGGRMLHHSLSPGGFGISRFTLDKILADIAVSSGVALYEHTRVSDVQFEGGVFSTHTSKGIFTSRTAAGTYGKRSNLDVKWKRPFVHQSTRKLNDYIGVKYHVQADLPANEIGLHNFSGGYCGISKVDDNRYCLCYLSEGENLKRAGNNIHEMEKRFLHRNPYLKEFFTSFPSLYDQPLAISQVSFGSKQAVEHHVLMAGDAAGLITPLCGNGMSMAMHASAILATEIASFLQGTQSLMQLEERYARLWKECFSTRLRAGRFVQSLFGDPLLTDLTISLLRPFPFVVNKLVSLTHGQAF